MNYIHKTSIFDLSRRFRRGEMSAENMDEHIDYEQEMGDFTYLAYSTIKENLLMMNDELDPDEVLDYLDDGNNFKKLSDVLIEMMVAKGIPNDTEKRIKEYKTISDYHAFIKKNNDEDIKLKEDDEPELFYKSLYALLAKQDSEGPENHRRKKKWRIEKVKEWIEDKPRENPHKKGNNTSKSIRSSEDAVSICFALALDFKESQDFLNKIGKAVLNIRSAKDAIYIYCLIKHESLCKAMDLFESYEKSEVKDAEELFSKTTSGNTTNIMEDKLFNLSNWNTDESFLDTFMIPNRKNFIEYSKTALREYYKLKLPIYLYTLRMQLKRESDNYKEWRIKQKINKKSDMRLEDDDNEDLKECTKVSQRFVSKLKKYSSELPLFMKADDMVDIHVGLKDKKGGYASDNINYSNNLIEVCDYLIESINITNLNDKELIIISDFLNDVVTAYIMLKNWLPSVADNDEDGSEYTDKNGNIIIKDSRKRKYSDSKLSSAYNVEKNTLVQNNTNSNLFLDSFPERTFFTKYENNPANKNLSKAIRKTIILLYYLNYAYASTGKLSSLNNMGEFELGFDSFIRNLNNILGKCQLGKLYLANQFDWLILESVEALETNDEKYYEGKLPSQFLNEIIDLSFSEEDDPDLEFIAE